MCPFAFAADVNEMWIFFLKSYRQSLHRNERFFGSSIIKIIAHCSTNFLHNCHLRWYEATDRGTHADDARTPTYDASPSTNDDASQARHDATRQIRASEYPQLFVGINRLSGLIHHLKLSRPLKVLTRILKSCFHSIFLLCFRFYIVSVVFCSIGLVNKAIA